MQELSAQLLQIPTASEYQVPLLSFAAHNQASNQAILILPALGISARFYKPLAARLAASGINAVIFEQRGHGHSAVRASRKVDYGFKHWLQDDIPAAVEWIKQYYGSELTLLGHSLGGHLAACYAGMYPQQINRLVLSACGSPWLQAFSGVQRIQLRLLQGASIAMGTVLGYYNGNVFGFGGQESKGLMRDWRQMVSHNSYWAYGMPEDLNKGVQNYPGQVLSVRYADDALAPLKSVQAVNGKFLNARLQCEVISSEQLGCKADHVNWVRNPQLISQLISDWQAVGDN